MPVWFRLFFPALIVAGCLGCSEKKVENSSTTATTKIAEPPNLAKGKALFVACQACHGESAQGNKKLHAPALTNLNDWYLYNQVMNFKTGLRGYLPADSAGLQMANAAAALSDSVAVRNVAAYIASLPDTEIPAALTGDYKKGERTYQSICGSCHGPQGKGNEAMSAPRLSGINDWYLKKQILNFKNGLRGGHPQDRYGAQMVAMAALLKDDQSINDVIVYLQSATQPVAR